MCVCVCVVLCLSFHFPNTPIRASVVCRGISWPSLKATQHHKVFSFTAPVHVVPRLCVCVYSLRRVRQIRGFFEDVFWCLQGSCGLCYCIFRTECEGLLREHVCEILIHTLCVKRLSSFITEKRHPESCFNSLQVLCHTRSRRIIRSLKS